MVKKDPNVQFADFEDTTDEWGWLIRALTLLYQNVIEIKGIIRDTDNIVGIVKDTDDIKGAIGKGTM